MSGFVFFWFVVVIGIIAFGVVRWYLSPDQKAKRALRAVPTLPIRQVAEGQLVKVSGALAYVGEPLIAPLSGRSCAAWRVEVAEYRRSGKSGHWHTIITELDAGELELDDGTGRARINALGAQLVIVKDAHYSSGTFNDATPTLELFLADHGYESTGFLGFNKGLRYEEGVLEEGEQVAVMGVARWELDPSAEARDARGYRDLPRRLVIDGAPGAQLVISDDPSVL